MPLDAHLQLDPELPAAANGWPWTPPSSQLLELLGANEYSSHLQLTAITSCYIMLIFSYIPKERKNIEKKCIRIKKGAKKKTAGYL
jgi:hypothetical protein